MAFQLKDFTSIVSSMINWMKSTQNKVTDFNEGSIARTLVEAPAAEIEELYRRMFDGIKEAIPVATYNSFNFNALTAQKTIGLVRVFINSQSSAVVISGGTTFTYQNGPVTYASSSDITIPAGNTYADVLVSASQAGSLGNIPANTQFTPSPAPTGFVSASNQSAWINGTDAETDDQRKLRFAAYVQTLTRATVAAITYGLSTVNLTDSSGNVTEHVASSQVVEPYETDPTQPIGLIQCYIHNGVGNTSAALVAQAVKVLYGYTDSSGNKVPGWKAAGTHVNVFAATELALNLKGSVTALAGYDQPTLAASATQTAIAYIIGLGVGQTFEVSEVIKQVKLITGVDDFIPSDVPAPVTPTLGSTAGGTLPGPTYYYEVTALTANGETIKSNELSVSPAHLSAPAASAPTTSTTGGTLAAATYYYKVTALGSVGETVGSNEVSVTTTGTTSSNTVTWGAVTGATGYRVYRGTSAGTESVYYAPGNVTSFTDTGAANTAGSPPTTNNAVTSTNANTITWGAVAGAIGYRVYRGTVAGGENVYYAPGNVTTFTDTGAANATGSPPASNTATIAVPAQNTPSTATTGGSLTAATYYYVVTALTASGETVKSNEQSIATTGSTSTVTVTWGAVAGATGYRVYRGTSAGAESVYYAPGNVTTFTDTGATSTAGTPPTTNTATIAAPTQSAPATAITGGTLAGAVSYYAEVTYITAQGETLASSTASLSVAANNLLTVASPSQIAGVTGWNVYVGTVSNNLQKQNAAPIGIGSGYTEPTSGLISGSTPPTVSTARLVNFTPTASQKLMPGTVVIS